MQKIILFYNFKPLADREAVRLWQITLAESLNLRGRIIISPHGINGTLGGGISDLKRYVTATKGYVSFKNTKFKWSAGGREDFPKLSVKVRDEIVTFGASDELKIDEHGVVGGGKHLTPEEVNQLVKERGDVVFFDGRSSHETAVGKFKGAVVTDVRASQDFIPELESGKYDELKDKPVVTYCTGGVRCEILTSLMKNRGWREVYQLDGGIVKYGEKFGDDDLWQGSLYVFDKRMSVKFSEKSEDIGQCIHCKSKTSNYENCANKACNKLVLICEKCKQDPSKLFHAVACDEQVNISV